MSILAQPYQETYLRLYGASIPVAHAIHRLTHQPRQQSDAHCDWLLTQMRIGIEEDFSLDEKTWQARRKTWVAEEPRKEMRKTQRNIPQMWQHHFSRRNLLPSNQSIFHE